MFYLTTHSTHFILRLYGDGHMVKDTQGFFYMHHPMAFVTPVVEHWLERCLTDEDKSQTVCQREPHLVYYSLSMLSSGQMTNRHVG